MEQALVERAGLKIELIAAAGLRGKNPLVALKNVGALSQGYRQSRQVMRRFGPDVVFVTGGYVCAPVTLAAWRAGVPIIIYLPDIEPGLAIKFLARFARRVAVTAPDAQQFFKPGLTVVTGYPVRQELFPPPPPPVNGGGQGGVNLPVRGEERRQIARRQLGLQADSPVLLVFGGSRGARSLNQAITGQLEHYLRLGQVIHITGGLDEAWVQAGRAELPPEMQARYRVSAYLHEEMVTALLAADLVVSRAGASVLGEFPAAGLPAILVPYPYAGAHQNVNAQYLARQQAAVVINDAELNRQLPETVFNLLTNRDKLQAMRQANLALARPDAAARLAQEIVEVGFHGRN